MKKLFTIALLISFGLNVYLIREEIIYQRNMEFGKLLNKAMGSGVRDVKWDKGLQMFNDTLKKKFPEESRKKYYYINMWAAFCHPCIKEMPWLDSLAGMIERKDVAYFFVDDHSAKTTDGILKHWKFNIRNFVFISGMSDFISSVYNEQKKKTIVFPTVLVMDANGKIYHSSTGAFDNFNEAKEFKEMIEKLP